MSALERIGPYRRVDGNEISAIMASIGGWTGLVKKNESLYGPQWVYVPKII